MNNWFKNWFASDEYLELYQHRNQIDAENLLNLIFNSISIKNHSRVLDAACGAGRHSIILAKKGFDVTGFDLSKNLLSKAVEKADKEKLNINFLNADIRNVSFKVKFNLILNLFTSFGYFESDDENLIFIKTAYESLLDDGYFILDYLNKNYVEKNIIPHSDRVIDNKNIHEKRYIENGRIIKEIVVKTKESSNQFFESVKLYNKNEIEMFFSEIGFKLVKALGDKSEFDEEQSSRVVLIFKK